MPTITAADVLNKVMYAKTDINLYDQTLNKKGSLPAGALIGEVYSYLTDQAGNIYWMFYLTPTDFANFNPTYVKHNADQLNLPSYADLLQGITDKIEADKLQSMGTVNYYIQKYAPYIVGGVVLALVLPPLLNSKKVSGMTKKKDNNKTALYFGGAIALAWYLTLKKRSGSVIVDPLDTGSFGPIVNQGAIVPLSQSIMPVVSTASILPIKEAIVPIGARQIDYVGPFEVSYRNNPSAMNGRLREHKKYTI
jgi:hypothetical protein